MVPLVLGFATLFAAPPLQADDEENPDVAAIVAANTGFACDLYAKLRETPGNLFVSPFSVSTALAMALAGARGDTEKEMAAVLRLALSRDRLHPAVKALLAGLDARSPVQERSKPPRKPFELVVANRLFGARGYAFRKEFLDLTGREYGAELQPVDFAGAADEARRTVNQWVGKKTNDRIKDILAPGSVGPDTRLVLVNAIYFKSGWEHRFLEAATRPRPFHLSPGGAVDVQTMQNTEDYAYFDEPGADGEGVSGVAIPYLGSELSMVVLVPRGPGGIAGLERRLTAEALARWSAALEVKNVHLFLPRFRAESSFDLAETLRALGLKRALDPKGADFGAMADTRELFLGRVVHKTFVSVDEQGTEAAAATAMMAFGADGDEPVIFSVDRPFLFLIRDNKTGSVLFMGRITDPR